MSQFSHLPPPPMHQAPPPPPQPQYKTPQHVLHVILSIISFGLWLPVWALCAWDASRYNAFARQQYERQCLLWQQACLIWSSGR